MEGRTDIILPEVHEEFSKGITGIFDFTERNRGTRKKPVDYHAFVVFRISIPYFFNLLCIVLRDILSAFAVDDML